MYEFNIVTLLNFPNLEMETDGETDIKPKSLENKKQQKNTINKLD